jgi:hypothetical protein
LAAACLGLLASGPLGPARAQGSGALGVDARFGLTGGDGGVDLPSGWVPVEVVLDNPGAPRDCVLELVVTRGQGPTRRVVVRLQRPLQLARGAKRRDWHLLPISPGYGDLEVRVRELDTPEGPGAVVAEAPAVAYAASEYARRGEAGQRILYISSDPRFEPMHAFWIQGAGNADTQLLGVRRPEHLPDHPLAYDAVDLVVLHDADTQAMGPAQAAALRRWVQAGGAAVLVPGRRLAWFSEPLIRELLGDGRVARIDADGLPAAERRHGSLLLQRGELTEVRAPFVAFAHRARSAKSEAEGALAERLGEGEGVGLSLFQPVRHGRGRVYLLATDLSAPPFDRWDGRPGLIGEIQRKLATARTPVLSQAFLGSGYGPSDDPFHRPRLAKLLDSATEPDQLSLVLIVILYVLVVGPLNLRWIRRRNQPLLVVLTLPALSLLFCGAVILSGYANKGLRTVVWRVSYVRAPLGATHGYEHTAVSIRSDSTATYAVGLDPTLVGARVARSDEQARDLTHRLTLGPEGLSLPGLPLRIWEQAQVEAMALRDLGEGLTVTGGGREAPVLHNGTPYRIARAGVVRRRRVIVVEDLAPGESRPVYGAGVTWEDWDADLARALLPPEAPAEQAELLERALEREGGSTTRSRVTVFALLAAPPSRITVDGEEVADNAVSLLVCRGVLR